jgi:hypothetical protein
VSDKLEDSIVFAIPIGVRDEDFLEHRFNNVPNNIKQNLLICKVLTAINQNEAIFNNTSVHIHTYSAFFQRFAAYCVPANS